MGTGGGFKACFLRSRIQRCDEYSGCMLTRHATTIRHLQMTRTPHIIGPEYDSDATLPDSVFGYKAKRDLALAALRRAETDGDDDVVRFMYWELGLIDLNASTDGDPSPYRGGAYDAFAAFYRITDDTVAYARERASETNDVVLRIHYLMFVLLRTEPRGRAWIEVQRELSAALRALSTGVGTAQRSAIVRQSAPMSRTCRSRHVMSGLINGLLRSLSPKRRDSYRTMSS